jgi:hypothetical protein
MSKEIIVNEVIVVGKVRTGQEQTQLPAVPANVDAVAFRSSKEFKEALRAKFSFVRTTVLNADAKALNFQEGPFLNLQVAGFGGNIAQLGNGKKINTGSKSDKLGWFVLFQSAHGTKFDEIKDEILANRFEVVGTGDEGRIRLTEYGLEGIWDEFALGFAYTPHARNPQTGVLEPMMSHPRLDNGKYGTVSAVSRTGRHFVLASQMDNLEGLRDELRENYRKWEIKVPASNVDANRSGEEKPQAPPPKVDISQSV